jgi:hypothetical protein
VKTNFYLRLRADFADLAMLIRFCWRHGSLLRLRGADELANTDSKRPGDSLRRSRHGFLLRLRVADELANDSSKLPCDSLRRSRFYQQ